MCEAQQRNLPFEESSYESVNFRSVFVPGENIPIECACFSRLAISGHGCHRQV